MSRTSSITIEIDLYEKINISSFIKVLKEKNWNLIDNNGNIRYTPLNDNENFDWTIANEAEYDNIVSIFYLKEKGNEIIAFTVNNTEEVGMDILIFPQFKSISFELSVNKKILSESYIADFNWYLNRIIPVFDQLSALVTFLKCTEIR